MFNQHDWDALLARVVALEAAQAGEVEEYRALARTATENVIALRADIETLELKLAHADTRIAEFAGLAIEPDDLRRRKLFADLEKSAAEFDQDKAAWRANAQVERTTLSEIRADVHAIANAAKHLGGAPEAADAAMATATPTPAIVVATPEAVAELRQEFAKLSAVLSEAVDVLVQCARTGHLPVSAAADIKLRAEQLALAHR